LTAVTSLAAGSKKTYCVSVCGATVPAGHPLPASQRAKRTTHIATTTGVTLNHSSLAERRTKVS